jgi:hypothetical protein
MCVEVVSSAVDEIERGSFPLNCRYQVYSLNIACACKRLAVAVVVVVMCWLRSICVLGWCVARLARLIGRRGIHPKWPIPGILTQCCLDMQTIGGGGGGSVLVEIDMHVGVMCGPVGEIDRQDGDLPKMADTRRTCSRPSGHANNWQCGWKECVS